MKLIKYSNSLSAMQLRMVLPFATVHTFCASQDGLYILIQRYFSAVFDYAENKVLAGAFEIQKENWG